MKHIDETFSRGILLLSFILSFINANGFSITAQNMGTMPSVIDESSGLDFTGGTHFWTMNDTYGDNKIYRIAQDGSLSTTIEITNAQNRNWEDLTHDANRLHMFIGDFGNNADDRTNLRIWKIPYPSSIAGTTVTAEEIKFTYSDQTQFPSHWMNFDAEAFLHFNGHLYIFTKPDGNAIGYTKMYRLSDDVGTHVATLVDSFYTNDRPTAADISPNGLSIVLSSNTHIHIFTAFNGDDFFGGTHVQINIAGSWTQKEGITFAGNDDVYMSDEDASGGNLYHMSLSQWIPAVIPVPIISTGIETITGSDISLFPSPANQFTTLSFGNSHLDKMSISLYDITGKMVYEVKIENTFAPFEIRTSEFTSGVYFYKVFADAKEIKTAKLVISH